MPYWIQTQAMTREGTWESECGAEIAVLKLCFEPKPRQRNVWCPKDKGWGVGLTYLSKTKSTRVQQKYKYKGCECEPSNKEWAHHGWKGVSSFPTTCALVIGRLGGSHTVCPLPQSTNLPSTSSITITTSTRNDNKYWLLIVMQQKSALKETQQNKFTGGKSLDF